MAAVPNEQTVPAFGASGLQDCLARGWRSLPGARLRGANLKEHGCAAPPSCP